MRHEGAKYQDGRDVKLIAKLFRADVDAAKRSGHLPADLKVSVRIRRYSGGQAIDVRFVPPAGMPLASRERVEYDLRGSPCDEPTPPFYSRKLTALVKQLEAMLDAYNYDNSDTMTDYFDVEFYGSVSVDDGSRYVAERDAIERELKSKAAEPTEPTEPVPDNVVALPCRDSEKRDEEYECETRYHEPAPDLNAEALERKEARESMISTLAVAAVYV